MTLREKIIMAVAGIALLYGAYELGLKKFFVGFGGQAARQESAGVETTLSGFTTQIAAQAGTGNLTDREQYIIDHRNSRWEKDPFVSGETMAASGNSEGSQAGSGAPDGKSFVYSGYIAVGDVRLAVINGREYKEGERLIDGKHVLRRIQPARVVLSGGGGEIIVKLQETEAKVD